MECRKCRIPMDPMTTTLEGGAAAVHIRVTNFPFFGCPGCGSHAYIDPEFPMYLLDAALAETPAADKAGFGQKLGCSNCRAPLDRGLGQPDTVSTTVRVRGGYTLGFEITAPGTACRSCGQRQFLETHRVLDGNISDALIAGLQKLEPIYTWKSS